MSQTLMPIRRSKGVAKSQVTPEQLTGPRRKKRRGEKKLEDLPTGGGKRVVVKR